MGLAREEPAAAHTGKSEPVLCSMQMEVAYKGLSSREMTVLSPSSAKAQWFLSSLFLMLDLGSFLMASLELTLVIFLLCEGAGASLRDTRDEPQGLLLAVIGLIGCMIEGRLAVLVCRVWS